MILERLGVVRPEVDCMLGRVAGIPVDIEPRFVTAERLALSEGSFSNSPG